MAFLQKYYEQIHLLCESHKVKSLFAFGSVTTDKFTADSDIDLVVDFENLDPIIYADNYFDLKFRLQELLKKPIDLLENKAMRNPFLRQQIDRTKVHVYGK
ncbi:MAG: nucleotidyltransferase family protein [Bacteroidia bacterium]